MEITTEGLMVYFTVIYFAIGAWIGWNTKHDLKKDNKNKKTKKSIRA